MSTGDEEQQPTENATPPAKDGPAPPHPLLKQPKKTTPYPPSNTIRHERKDFD
jgi:hypothetical protein